MAETLRKKPAGLRGLGLWLKRAVQHTVCVTVVRLTFQRANVKNIGAYRKGKKGIQKAKERQQQKTKE